MRILTPQWSLQRFDRYLPLLKSISDRVNEFHVAYVEGRADKLWEEYFRFQRVTMPYGFVKSRTMSLFLSRARICKQTRDVEPDVIFCLSELWMQELSRYCSNKMRVPYVVWLRGNHREVRKAMNVNPFKEKLLNYLETRSLKSASMVIPNSLDLAEKAREWGIKEQKITSPVYAGVDTSMFRPMGVERSSRFTVAYAGRISPEKRIPELLRAAGKLPETHFVIAGVKQIDVTFPSNVEYLGQLSFSEMPCFYNGADVVVLPSVTEGFPGVILEAYACGKPVLVTREALPKELKLFGSLSSIDQFDKELEALRQTDLKALGDAARAYVQKHFTWEEFGKSMARCLENAVQRRSESPKNSES